MTSDTIELVERVSRRLREHENTCEISGPAPESAISAAEVALGVTFPPSYRTFLRTFGGIVIPAHLGIVHDFVGVSPDAVYASGSGPTSATNDESDAAPTEAPVDPSVSNSAPAAGFGSDVVSATLHARAQRKLGEHLVVVGIGADSQEWFCLDTLRALPNGECPILLFDARDNALDQQFYDDFGQMLDQVMGFVADSLEQPLD